MTTLSRIVLVNAIFIMTLYACAAQEMNKKVIDANGREKLLGKIDKNGLQQDAFITWFDVNYREYQMDTTTMAPLKKELDKFEIRAFMGTWCGDSRREVPRFYKILEELGYPAEKMKMVAVDYIKPNYKKSPGGEEKGLKIIKVPTFIFFKNGKEVNRIVESPIVSLEKDMVTIVSGAHYIPKYANLLKLPQD